MQVQADVFVRLFRDSCALDFQRLSDPQALDFGDALAFSLIVSPFGVRCMT